MTAPSFDGYCAAVATLLRAPERLADDLAAAERAGLGPLNAAIAAERDARAAARATTDELDRLTSRVLTLCHAVGGVEPTPAEVTVSSQAEAERLVKALTTDVAAAESALAWVTRNAHLKPVAPLAPQAPVAQPVARPEPPTPPDAPSRGRSSRGLLVALAAIVVVIGAVVLLVVR
jgi:hypothetical protein